MWANQPIQEWIDTVCRQYSRIMGCALTFDPHVGSVSPIPQPTESNPIEQWRIAIGDGTQTLGVLRLRSRAGQPRDAGYLQACEAAELTARLIERAITTRDVGESDSHKRCDPTISSAVVDSGNGRHTRETPAASTSVGSAAQVATELERLLDAARRMTGFPAAALFTLDRDNEAPQLTAIRTTESLEGLAFEIARFPPLLDSHGAADQFTVVRRSLQIPGEASALPCHAATGVGLPVVEGNEHRAALWLFDRRDRRLTHRDRHALAKVVSRLGQHLNHARLVDESSQSREFKGELRAASRSQPSSQIEYVAPNGWCEVAGCMQSVRGIGGDLLELIPLAQGRILVALGDAAGHSLPAALIMANVRGALHALFDGNGGDGNLPPSRPPQEILARVNSILYGIVQSHQFMTMFCGVFDGESLTLEYANAGHPQPLLLRDGQVVRLESHGLVLGVTDDARYASATVPLCQGDVLTLYTDGVTEASCRARTQFGLSAMEEIVTRHADQSAAEIRDKLWAALQSHLIGSGQRDDRTLAVVRIAGR